MVASLSDYWNAWMRMVYRPRTGIAVALLLALAPLATSAADNEVIARFAVGDGSDEIGVIADVPNLAPQGPSAIAASPRDALFVLDSVNGRILRVLPAAEPPPSIAIPETRYATDLVVTGDFYYVLDSLGRQVLKYAAGGNLVEVFPVEDPDVDLAGSTTLVVLPDDDIRIRQHGAKEVAVGAVRTRGIGEGLATATPRGTVSSRFVRTDAATAQIDLAGTVRTRGVDAPQTLPVDSKDFLASAELVGMDEQGRYYVLAEEMKTDVAELTVHTALARYSESGKLEEVADIPVAEAVFLPNRYVAVTGTGEAYFLKPLEQEVQLVKLGFSPRETISAPEQSAPQMRGIPPAPLEVDEAFQATVRSAYADDIPPKTRGLGISRDRILENARRYLHLDWTLRPENYSKSGAQSRCDPPGAKWRRPPYLEGKTNQTIRAVPYKWGGYDSLTRFQDRLGQGYLAGDICTCRKNEYGYCITGDTTGVDCSGFVSRVLEENYYTTSRMHEITKPLPSFQDLKPGDILNRAGRHVRLFVGFSEEGPLVLNTIESAVSCGGVCATSYKVSQLSGYKPLRYKFLGE